ncbi:hypothetical protein UD08_00090 [Campylobacter coli]|uniref:hypothetical protein n=1 Tax=Campylobacter coli TaxID=195 RepID=UPI000707770F|nr:hypothetical protein [Campylobacter coli]KQH22705.1 hypothetical protein UD08_00090 [Campylobacter coli]
MLVSKTTLSYLNDTNLKEHILFAIQNKAVLAIINRDFTEDENGNRIDDITHEEIQAGTQAIKKYCLENNELELLKQYLPLVLQDEALLNETKDIMFVVIKLKAEKLPNELLVDKIPDSEVATFTTQRSEAIAYRNSGYTNDNLCPMLKIISEIRAMPLRDLVDKCLLKSSLYETELAKILGKRQKLEDDIKKAQTLEELNLIVW